MTEIAEYLAHKGMDVHVITTGLKYNEFNTCQPDRKEVHNGVYIERVIGKNFDKNNFLERGIGLLVYSLRLFKSILLKVKRGDKILLVTNPAFLLLLMPVVTWVKRTKYCILVHDVFPENLVAIGKIKSTSFKYRRLKSLFDFSYRKADLCISIGRDMTSVLELKTKGRCAIKFIPNWSDIKNVFPLDKKSTELSKQLNIGNKFVFMFAGNLGYVQGLDNILRAIDSINNNDVLFLFIGGGAKANDIQKYAEKHANVIYVELQERNKQNDFLNACDVAIVSLSKGMYGLGVPSKTYNTMAAGKPILYIGDESSEVGLCIKEYKLGWVVEPNNPQKLKEQIELILKYQEEKLNELQWNSRNVAEHIFAKELILEKYYQLFK